MGSNDVLYTEFDDQEVQEFLRDMGSRLKKIKGADGEYVGLLSAIVYGDVIEHFEAEQGPTGPWAKWSQSYTEAVEGKAFYRTINGRKVRISAEDVEAAGGKMPKPPRKPGQILQATGRLRNSFKPTKYRKTSAGILWFNDAKTKTGFGYAGAHDEGTDLYPARPFMWLSDKARDQVSVQTLQFLIDKGV